MIYDWNWRICFRFYVKFLTYGRNHFSFLLVVRITNAECTNLHSSRVVACRIRCCSYDQDCIVENAANSLLTVVFARGFTVPIREISIRYRPLKSASRPSPFVIASVQCTPSFVRNVASSFSRAVWVICACSKVQSVVIVQQSRPVLRSLAAIGSCQPKRHRLHHCAILAQTRCSGQSPL